MNAGLGAGSCRQNTTAGTLPTAELDSGAHDWTRTSDLSLTKGVLYHLSYAGVFALHLRPSNTGAGDRNRTDIISLEG